MARWNKPKPAPPIHVPSCACGSPVAPFGIGPPMEAVQRWLCHECWSGHPSRQNDLARILRAAMEEDDL